VQFLHNLLKIFFSANPDTLKVKDEYNALDTELGVLDNYFKTNWGSDKTDKLVELDDERDNAFIGIRDNVGSYQRHYDPKKREAANVLMRSIDTYGRDANKLDYPAETALINNMLNDWTTKPELMAAVAELKLGDWLTFLKQTNDDFDALYISRSQEMGSKIINAVKIARGNSIVAYYNLRDMFLASYKMNKGVPPFDKVLTDVNGVIDTYNDILSRKTQNNKPPTPPQPK
jgi:hypothetical protein